MNRRRIVDRRSFYEANDQVRAAVFVSADSGESFAPAAGANRRHKSAMAACPIERPTPCRCREPASSQLPLAQSTFLSPRSYRRFQRSKRLLIHLCNSVSLMMPCQFSMRGLPVSSVWLFTESEKQLFHLRKVAETSQSKRAKRNWPTKNPESTAAVIFYRVFCGFSRLAWCLIHSRRFDFCFMHATILRVRRQRFLPNSVTQLKATGS